MNIKQFCKFSPKFIIAVVTITLLISLLLISTEYMEIKKIKQEVSHYKIEDHSSNFHRVLPGKKIPQNILSNFGYERNMETGITDKTLISEGTISANKTILNKTNNKLLNQEMLASKALSLGNSVECYYNSNLYNVSCRSGNIQEVIEKVNTLMEEQDPESTVQHISLQLNETIFPSNVISEGWLTSLKRGITKLEIRSTDLEELEKSAFSGKPFRPNLFLTLVNTNIKQFRKSSFAGTSFSILEIRFDIARQDITFEEGTFDDTGVQSLNIKQCLGSGEAIMNLTGKGKDLPHLVTLDLSYNQITKLEAGTFSKATNLIQLDIMSSSITEIELGAFSGLNNILQLYLQHNSIKSFTKGVFDDLDLLRSFYLQGNPFNCTCDMLWFKKYLLSLPEVEVRKCKVGSSWLTMSDVEFCSDNDSTTTSVTKVPSKTTKNTKSPVTTAKPTGDFIFEKILCRNLLSYPFENIGNDNTGFLLTSVFKRRNTNLTISEIGNSVIYTVELTGTIKSTDFFIWRNVKNNSDYGCIYNINGNILMDLQFERTYTLCFASNDTDDTYALIAEDCTAVSTPPEWNHRAWLYNDQKVAIILSVSATLLTTLAIACGAVYYLVKYNPELIKGNKRVLIVKRGSYSPNVLVMPSKKDATRHVSLSTNHEGYLTPKLKRWTKTKFNDLRYHELDTISDKSITDHSSDRMIRYDDCCDDKINEKNIYEPPPPLPPNHPSKRRESVRPYFHSNM